MLFLNKKLATILVSKSFLSLFLRVLGMGFSYLFSLIVAHLYGAEGWGVFSLIFTLVLFGSYILKFGFDTALLKLTAANEAIVMRARTCQIYISAIKYIIPAVLLVCVVFYFASNYFAISMFHKPYLQSYLPYVSVLTLPAVLILINAEGLRGLGKINQYAIFQNSSAFALGTLGLIVLELFDLGKHEIADILIVYTISTYIIFLLSQVSWWRNIREYVSNETFSFRYIYNVSVPMFWIGVMLMAIGWTDTLILSVFSTEKEVGIYNVALRISNLVIVGRLSMNAIVANQFSSLHSLGDTQGLKILAKATSKKVFFLSLPIIIVIVSFPDFLLGLFGTDFKEGVIILIVLSLGNFVNSFYGTPDTILQMTGHEHFFKIIITLAVVINLVLNLILIPFFGGLGAAITNMISLTFWNIGSAIYIKQQMGIYIVYNPFRKHIA